ncbi:type III restriction enzyme res subunit [Calothrix brevissima NIES-22]|nr:type III restriction enzyme res subunit [Calothrix brevissima NIES-22]
MKYKQINLDDERGQHVNSFSKQPFQHQIEAFAALNKTFKFDSEKTGNGLLVLPTGAGKTFTAVRWLCNHVISKYIKILWLAPSFYLLDQAADTFDENAREISESRKTLNIRCVSSNSDHAKTSSIETTDDVLMMTMQTAIKNLHLDALDKSGDLVHTAFRKFVESCRETGLFVVIDEAHHSPAYGCRNLLIGDKDSALGLRSLIPQVHFLGLTATPTYTDKSRRGWLWKIFSDEIIYKADKTSLIAQNIIARPKYIEMRTGNTIEVGDQLYDHLVKKHKDLPEEIIQELAENQKRNDFIINTYVANKNVYGKTIIFVDRWFQCVYLKEQLEKKGVKADAIYSYIDVDPGSADARNKKTQDKNKEILKRFKTGKDEDGNSAPIDVLINVRMLTEGADVPSVKTVFITRQTTSTILITQMIGRALRGEKAGGSSEANIVLFVDDWKRLIDWPELDGGTECSDEKPSVIGHYPLEYISIRLVEELSRQIESGGVYTPPPVSKILPVGWYETVITYADADDNHDSIEAFTQFVMVYDHTKSKFDSFISSIISNIPDEWSKEYLQEEWMVPQIDQWIDEWFDKSNDDIGNKLVSDLINIVRHISQNQNEPVYHPFEERDIYDLDKLVEKEKLFDFSIGRMGEYIKKEFNDPHKLWKTFYKNVERFDRAVYEAIRNREKRDTIIIPRKPDTVEPDIRELTEAEKEQIKKRDGCTCLCCGAKEGIKVRLQIDHIKPVSVGGETSLENSQTLCSICNNFKKSHEIDFRINSTQLQRPKLLNLSLSQKDCNPTEVITRIVNFFYHCKAISQVSWHEMENDKSDSFVTIQLNTGNNPEWLLQHKVEIIHFIKNELGYHVQDINVISLVTKQPDTEELKKGRGYYDRKTKIYTNPETGESGDIQYWSEKLGMGYSSFWRRIINWGEDNNKTFQPISCKGDPKKCNKFNSDVTYTSTVAITKELAQKIEEVIASQEYEFITDIFKAAVDKFQIREDHKELLISKKNQGERDKTKTGKLITFKLNDEQKAKVDELIMVKQKWLEYSGNKRFVSQSEVIMIILNEFFNMPTTDVEISKSSQR